MCGHVRVGAALDFSLKLPFLFFIQLWSLFVCTTNCETMKAYKETHANITIMFRLCAVRATYCRVQATILPHMGIK